MKTKLLIFLAVISMVIGLLVFIEQKRQQPEYSDVFFGMNDKAAFRNQS
ncbi:hypothetical Protein YC6258_02433 [Gynuella sunshinyii YC6258]|uniref:Uncharacterized protein n=1 Tax=Gynuella sunshinyii YC6258 TaxID=1445510 RepID=A0A0C5VJK3_9GAMM|nr:hypothetical Protein YC6258_02433 [Gynuella sunshinyii YC6258]